MKELSVEQGSPDWFQARLERPLTASESQAIGNQGKGLETLVMEKMAEKYSSGTKERYSNDDTNRGTELEPQARELYELETGRKVRMVGFITNDPISEFCGASPDGLVDYEGLIEIKSFDDTKHFEMTLEEDFKIESKYLWQMQMQMLVCEKKWCDFVAYNPNYKKSLLIRRIYPDLIMQEKIRTGLMIGGKIIKEIESKLKL